MAQERKRKHRPASGTSSETYRPRRRHRNEKSDRPRHEKTDKPKQEKAKQEPGKKEKQEKPKHNLLKSVSRSFYLSIQFLPKSLRPTIGLGYLLARASDTIADNAGGSAPERIALLEAFTRLVKLGNDAEYLREIHRCLAGKIKDHDERRLLEQLQELIDQLDRLPLEERSEVVRVLLRILYAQELDLKWFPDREKIRATADATALDEYTYFIAGSVGEFWTRVCRAKAPDFSDLNDAKLLPLAVRFGKGLQLVNILRDIPNDLKNGRCYLPAEELEAAGITPEDLKSHPAKARPIIKRWMKTAKEHLEAGWEYVQAVKNLRIRYACAIPILIGLRTLALMQKNPPLESKEKIKVSRSEVKMILLKAGVGTLISPFLNQTFRSLQKQLAKAS